MTEHRRITQHPILGELSKRDKISFQFDGQILEAYQGDTIASALLANGIRKLRKHEASGTPRGIYCNIGHCYECRVTVYDNENIRACLTEVQPDMIIKSGQEHDYALQPKSIS